MDLRKVVREIPNFPHEGILFRDITPVLLDPETFSETLRLMGDKVKSIEFDVIAGPESRGFIFGVPLAVQHQKGFIPVRKAGKLPCETIKKTYELEYGSATIEIHADAIKPGQRVLVVDDLLATGGTCKALCEMIESAGGVVAGLLFLIELKDLGGRVLLEGYPVFSVLEY